MGCDIHAKIEYQRFPKHPSRWDNFAMDICLPRDYGVFAAMLDGHARDSGEWGGVAPARGLPTDGDNFWMTHEYVHEHWNPDPACTADWGHSWLTTAEFAEALGRVSARRPSDPVSVEYRVTLAMMQGLEAAGHPARIVFGFDN